MLASDFVKLSIVRELNLKLNIHNAPVQKAHTTLH
jgi:hypothetical protein